jgi:hypothetical protein
MSVSRRLRATAVKRDESTGEQPIPIVGTEQAQVRHRSIRQFVNGGVGIGDAQVIEAIRGRTTLRGRPPAQVRIVVRHDSYEQESSAADIATSFVLVGLSVIAFP